MREGRQKKICVLGAGSWGTALANHLSNIGHCVNLWGRDKEIIDCILLNAYNPKYLKGEKINKAIKATTCLREAIVGVDLLVYSVSSVAIRSICNEIKEFVDDDMFVLSTSKGLDEQTGGSLSDVMCQIFDNKDRIGVLSGPSFAIEVLKEVPTAVTIACRDIIRAKIISSYFHYNYFRVYTSHDIKGVELSGVLKNVVALAVGMVDGAQIGNNARAALITRGLHEIKSLVVALGGKESTVMGLSGLGDLILTATCDLSRNRSVGLRLGRGEELSDILNDMKQVVEGVKAARLALNLAERIGLDTPIIREVNNIISGSSNVDDSVDILLSRKPKFEM